MYKKHRGSQKASHRARLHKRAINLPRTFETRESLMNAVAAAAAAAAAASAVSVQGTLALDCRSPF